MRTRLCTSGQESPRSGLAWNLARRRSNGFASQGANLPRSGLTATEYVALPGKLKGWHRPACQDRRPSPADLSQAQENEKALRLRQEECHKRHGAIEEQIRQLQHDLEQQAEVRGQMDRVEHQLKLHKKLAQMLTANGLKAFVANPLLHEILRLASAELERLSGRYQLQLEDGDILVVDNWNAGETRDVRSLSGGETFLASLSLALAMVDYLSQGSPLESLFIDEGFGTLDPETLEAVTLTLESLHEKGRLVGVITHVQELAERLPMQVR